MMWLVQKCAWSAKSLATQMCLLRQGFQLGLTIILLSLQSRGTRMCVCGVCVCEWDSESLWAFGCSTGEDKVVWCLLTWSMIHNWGRTAVAGCTDRSQGGWQMIGPSGAELSISPNVLCPLSAHLSFISLPDICKPSSHRSAILFCSLNMISCCSIKDYCRYRIQGGHQIIKNPIYNQIIFCVSVNSNAVFKQSHKKLLSEY